MKYGHLMLLGAYSDIVTPETDFTDALVVTIFLYVVDGDLQMFANKLRCEYLMYCFVILLTVLIS